ncbi:MAG: hypothetical protein COA79_26130 [Planctomycetota bacterium]|nr:MAG: hypothetical protein COA79_26130 [Planctomycetota bacterium]
MKFKCTLLFLSLILVSCSQKERFDKQITKDSEFINPKAREIINNINTKERNMNIAKVKYRALKESLKLDIETVKMLIKYEKLASRKANQSDGKIKPW